MLFKLQLPSFLLVIFQISKIPFKYFPRDRVPKNFQSPGLSLGILM